MDLQRRKWELNVPTQLKYILKIVLSQLKNVLGGVGNGFKGKQALFDEIISFTIMNTIFTNFCVNKIVFTEF